MCKCQACGGSGFTGPGWPIIGLAPCALCNGTGDVPKLPIMKPRYIAWYGGDRPVLAPVEVINSRGEVILENVTGCRLDWSRQKDTDITPNIIAYRVIDQD